MTTNHYISDYNYTPNSDRWNDYTHMNPQQTGPNTNRTKNGLYNITEKEVNGQKLLYYVPTAYGNNYDLSQLDEGLNDEEQSTDVRRSADIHNYTPTPRRDKYVPPRRPKVIKRTYFDPSPPPPPPPPTRQKIVYIYEKAYIPQNKDIVDYVVRDRVPRRRYVEEMRPIRQTVYVDTFPKITRSVRASPASRPAKPVRISEYSSSSSFRPRIAQPTSRDTPIRILSRNTAEQKTISLNEVLAENRARRSSRVQKPRREVNGEQTYELPPLRKNYVKRDFLVHK